MNLAGCEPDGIVDTGDFEKVWDQVMESFEKGAATSMSYLGATLASEMEAALWTAITVLAATSLGSLFYLGSRIDALAARMDARIDSVDAKVDAGFTRMDLRFDAMESRFDALGSRLDAHLERHAG